MGSAYVPSVLLVLAGSLAEGLEGGWVEGMLVCFCGCLAVS
jgi:hypothetical protein